MDKAVIKTITDYIKLIQQKYSNFETAYIFGSHAKGNSSLDSDIDLAIIFKDLDDSKRFDVQVSLMLLASQIDTRIEPHPISHNDFYAEDPFSVEIKRTGFKI